MAEPTDLDAVEVQSLRQEITTRIGLMNALVALELAAVGTGFSIVHDSVYVLVGLAVISGFLWLLWADQCLSSYKIAAYLSIELAPRLRELTGRPVLGWENFLRRVESGGRESALALYRGSPPLKARIVRQVRADWYAPLLFGLTPPLLLALYVNASLHNGADLTIIVVPCFFAGLFWLFTISRFVDFVHNTKVLDNAIVAAGHRPAPAESRPAGEGAAQ